MDNLTTEQKIERLEKELADLRSKQLAEKEEAAKKKRAERDADLQRIHDLLDEFNKKYDDCLNVNRCQNTTEDWIKTLFRCL